LKVVTRNLKPLKRGILEKQKAPVLEIYIENPKMRNPFNVKSEEKKGEWYTTFSRQIRFAL
jgi:hypothetical protein